MQRTELNEISSLERSTRITAATVAAFLGLTKVSPQKVDAAILTEVANKSESGSTIQMDKVRTNADYGLSDTEENTLRKDIIDWLPVGTNVTLKPGIMIYARPEDILNKSVEDVWYLIRAIAGRITLDSVKGAHVVSVDGKILYHVFSEVYSSHKPGENIVYTGWVSADNITQAQYGPTPTPLPTPDSTLTSQSASSTINNVELAQTITHTVQWGETVYSLARRYGVTPKQIVDANHLANPNIIQVGQVLEIPGVADSQSAQSLTPEIQTVQVGEQAHKIYNAKKGESLALIAEKYHGDQDIADYLYWLIVANDLHGLIFIDRDRPLWV